jgi:hypothetical protein
MKISKSLAFLGSFLRNYTVKYWDRLSTIFFQEKGVGKQTPSLLVARKRE